MSDDQSEWTLKLSDALGGAIPQFVCDPRLSPTTVEWDASTLPNVYVSQDIWDMLMQFKA